MSELKLEVKKNLYSLQVGLEKRTVAVEKPAKVLMLRTVELVRDLSGGRTKVIDEAPIGMINGSNATFTTAQNFLAESVEVTLNGLSQRKGAGFDYITTGNNTIIFSVSPDVGDTILVDYEVL